MPQLPANLPVPRLLRFAAGTAVRTTGWGLGAAVAVARGVSDAARQSEVLVDLVEDALGAARKALGVQDLEDRLARLLPAAGDEGPSTYDDLNIIRRRGRDLLDRSTRLDSPDEPVHPAFPRILSELTPDEGRMLRLLATDGDQPMVEIQSAGRMGGKKRPVRLATGLSTHAALRHPDRESAYLDNLQRLALIELLSEPTGDKDAYELLAAQPAVRDAVTEAKKSGRARLVRRSVGLSDFGRLFYDTCLPPQWPY